MSTEQIPFLTSTFIYTSKITISFSFIYSPTLEFNLALGRLILEVLESSCRIYDVGTPCGISNTWPKCVVKYTLSDANAVLLLLYEKPALL